VQGNSLKTLKQVRMYPIPVSDPRVSELITWYIRTLQRAVDIIWENIEWKYRFPKMERRKRKQVVITPYKLKVPELPKSKSFKKRLRDEFLLDCPYARHWVDAVIRTAYSIMENWRKRYLRGRARKVKPRIRRRFARCKITLMKIDYESKTIRITLKPGEYLSISWRSTWFEHRVRGWGFSSHMSSYNLIWSLPHLCSPAFRSGFHRAWGRSGPPQGPHILSV
jgi:putative transposase